MIARAFIIGNSVTGGEHGLNTVNFPFVLLLAAADFIHLLDVLGLADLSGLSGHLGNLKKLSHVFVHILNLSPQPLYLAVFLRENDLSLHQSLLFVR